MCFLFAAQVLELTAYKWPQNSGLAHGFNGVTFLFGFIMLLVGSAWRYSDAGMACSGDYFESQGLWG
jgi:hypothetical protein